MHTHTVLLLVILASCVIGGLLQEERQYESKFHKFMKDFKRTYKKGDSEYLQRFEYFKINLDFIETHNANPSKTFEVALNEFGDWSRDEYRSILTWTPPTTWTPTDSYDEKVAARQNLPTNFDWRDHGAVTAVKNQMQCGSSPYFSSVTSYEGCFFLDSGALTNFSVQQIVDCSGPEGNQGCDGGYMTQSFQSIIDKGGIDTDNCYPYVGEDGESCNFKKNPPCCGGTLETYVNVTANEKAVQAAVYIAPVATAMDASQSSIEFYSSGVYWDPQCSSTTPNHGIPIVGWGVTSNGTEYWILKNSWGTSWGLQGYIWLARNDGNMCGIADYPSYAVGCYDCLGN